MFTSDDAFHVYRDLADYHDRQGLDQLRDRFLVLAAAAAQSAGNGDEAERLRQRLLKGNTDDRLRPFASIAQAMASPDVQTYVEELQLEYPLKAAEDLRASVLSPSLPDRQRATRALPPTAPVIDLDRPAESLKVFPNQADAEAPTLPAWQEPPPRKTSFPSARPSKLFPAAASTRPATIPVRRSPLQERPVRPERGVAARREDTEEVGGGAWVCYVLFGLVLAAGLYLAGVTLLGPFLR